MQATQPHSGPDTPVVPDAAPGNWVDRHAPQAWRPYLRLARADRPVGAWLLLFPCWWSQALAELSLGRAYPNLWYALLFAVGAFVMRGAGCVYNDIVDRDYDAGVARTRNRPIPSGQVTVAAAKAFMVALCLVGLVVLMQFNGFAVVLGIAVARTGGDLSLHEALHLLAAARPRPDVQVGRADGLGGRHGRARLARAPAVCGLHPLDHRLRHDLRPSGQGGRRGARPQVHGPAVWRRTPNPGSSRSMVEPWCSGRAPDILPALASIAAAALASVAAHFVWQIRTLDISDPQNCLVRFRSNCTVGWLLAAGLSPRWRWGALMAG